LPNAAVLLLNEILQHNQSTSTAH